MNQTLLSLFKQLEENKNNVKRFRIDLNKTFTLKMGLKKAKYWNELIDTNMIQLRRKDIPIEKVTKKGDTIIRKYMTTTTIYYLKVVE